MKNKVKRGLMVVLGVIIIGISIGMLRIAALGVDPCTSMVLGIASVLNLNSMSAVLIPLNIVLLIGVILKRRDLIGFGTLVNMFCVGPVADIFVAILMPYMSEPLTMTGRILFMIGGVLVCCFGVAIYFSAHMGVAPYDAMAYVIESTTHGKIPFKYARIITDVICVIIGASLGMMSGDLFLTVGIGTLIMMTCTGPIVQFFIDKVGDPLYRRASKVQNISSSSPKKS